MLLNFPYIKRDTLLHRLDPRTKITLLLVFSLCVVQTSNFWFILAALIIAFFYYSRAHLKWSETKRTWRFIIAFVAVLTFVNYFISGGAVVQVVVLSLHHIPSTLPFFAFKRRSPFLAPPPLIFTFEA